MLFVLELLSLRDRVPKYQLSVVATSRQELQFGHHYHG